MAEPYSAGLLAGRYELVDRLDLADLELGDGSPDDESREIPGVWRIWDRKGNAYLAARVVRHGEAGALLRFIREKSARLRHPHIIAPSGWAGEEELVVFTMPLVKGGSVTSLVREVGSLPAEWIAVVLDQLLGALTEAHSLGIVHGDIRASRLLLEPTGTARPHVKLSGFGRAIVTGEPREDLSALGAVAAELLVGMAPGGQPAVSPAHERTAPLGVHAKLWDVLAHLAAGGSGLEATEIRTELVQSGCVPADWSRVDSDALVEVVERLPALPEGWGPRGPQGLVVRPDSSGRLRTELPAPLDEPEHIDIPEIEAEGDDGADGADRDEGVEEPDSAGDEEEAYQRLEIVESDPAPEDDYAELPDPDEIELDLEPKRKRRRGARRANVKPVLRPKMPKLPKLGDIRLPSLPRLSPARVGTLRLVGTHALILGSGLLLAAAVLLLFG